MLQLANLLQSNPNQWYRAFCNSKTSVKELSILLPDAELSELSKVVQVDQLQEILSELITNLKNAENLPTASGLIDLFYKLNICKFLSLVPLDTKIHRNIFMVLWLKEDDDLSLQEVVDTWKQAMIKESEGIDCCLICIKDTEMTNNTLPDISCHNCHNKYHSYCIDSLTENKDKCVYCSEKLE